MPIPSEDLWLLQEFKLSQNLLEQALSALHKNRLKRAEKLTQEAVKVAHRLKEWKNNLPPDKWNSEVADAIDELYKAATERRDLFEEIAKDRGIANKAK